MGVVLRARNVRGESHIKRNANGEVATCNIKNPFERLCVRMSLMKLN